MKLQAILAISVFSASTAVADAASTKGHSAQASGRTCTYSRDLCIKHVRARGNHPNGPRVNHCRYAHSQCLVTGVWQTSGPYGMRIDNVIRR